MPAGAPQRMQRSVFNSGKLLRGQPLCASGPQCGLRTWTPPATRPHRPPPAKGGAQAAKRPGGGGGRLADSRIVVDLLCRQAVHPKPAQALPPASSQGEAVYRAGLAVSRDLRSDRVTVT